jgi:hypothetical protein
MQKNYNAHYECTVCNWKSQPDYYKSVYKDGMVAKNTQFRHFDKCPATGDPVRLVEKRTL